MQSKVRSNHLRCKLPNKYLNVREWVEAVEEKKDGALPFTAVKENLDRTKSKLFTFLRNLYFPIFLYCAMHVSLRDISYKTIK